MAQIDLALRGLSRSANKGRLWFAIAAGGALAGRSTRRAAVRGIGALAVTSFAVNVLVKTPS